MLICCYYWIFNEANHFLFTFYKLTVIIFKCFPVNFLFQWNTEVTLGLKIILVS